ncbi:replication protein A 70 kDa DNA-binding subunit A-like [Euphorbia lathyris]|uniref:replication protein A 70 kDa DNA-binding subunit A-like n=1 Tax=Euphorbia lathyris TaxID=212925 RepID=UPI0033136C07
MDTVNLTEGAIAKIMSGATAELKPVLQVTELKQVQTKQPQQSDRFRLILSDGTHLQQAMLGTQINHLVKDRNLRTGSIVQLLQYTCTSVQSRVIIIILELVVILDDCGLIGNPVSTLKPSVPLQSSTDQPVSNSTNSPSFGANLAGGVAGSPNLAGASLPNPRMNQFQSGLNSNNYETGRYGATNAPPSHLKVDPGTGLHGTAPINRSYNEQASSIRNPRQEVCETPGTYSYPNRSAYQQPPPMYSNRGPVARNEAPPRIMPISALNPYQGRWTIKARVTAKGELRHYNNTRGDGKVFSFDLLDSDGGEIRVTCFNAVADQFYDQIEAGKVYLISKGSLKPAQKNFNHLHNDLEIFLEISSVIQPCSEDDNSIPRQQFHFRSISEIESMDNNSIVDIIGIVSSITPTASIMRKNGMETQKRTLQLKDMSGRSVELTLWGNLCNTEGQRVQSMCDLGVFPVLAVKTARVNDFNGKAVGTIATSQLFLEPDFPEARSLKEWFEREGKNAPSVSISREMLSAGRVDVPKTISQIKDEKLGTSEKPDWITVNGTVIFVKADNFCYTACPIIAGDRACNKKVTNNGDGKWWCEKCDRSMDECAYRYILQLQIQDHTGITWATAFDESGEEIMGISAKELHSIKYDKQDDDSFSKILRQVLFSRFVFKLKVKEETFSDEQRVKSTVFRAEKMNYSSHSRFLLDMMEKFKSGNIASSAEAARSDLVGIKPQIENIGGRAGGPLGNYQAGNSSYAAREFGVPANQVGQYGNQSSRISTPNLSCNSCGSTNHNSSNCPSIMNAPKQPATGIYANRSTGSGGKTGECFKCGQVGHWSRDCPGPSSGNAAYGSTHMSSGRFGGVSKQQVGGF